MLSCHILVSQAIKWPSYRSIDLFSHKEQIKWPYRHTPTPKTSRPCSSPCQHWPQTPLGLILTPAEHALLSVIEPLRGDNLSYLGDDLVTMVTKAICTELSFSRNVNIQCMICFVYIFCLSYIKAPLRLQNTVSMYHYFTMYWSRQVKKPTELLIVSAELDTPFCVSQSYKTMVKIV